MYSKSGTWAPKKILPGATVLNSGYLLTENLIFWQSWEKMVYLTPLNQSKEKILAQWLLFLPYFGRTKKTQIFQIKILGLNLQEWTW